MSGNKNNKVILGGITKKTSCDNLIGFTIAFEDTKLAIYYKKMFYYILSSDKFKIEVKKGIKNDKDINYEQLLVRR